MAKCQLCGGKICNGRCSLCGWINQDKKEYLLNKSSCDDKPLTHVHREQSFGSFPKTEKKTGISEIPSGLSLPCQSLDFSSSWFSFLFPFVVTVCSYILYHRLKNKNHLSFLKDKWFTKFVKNNITYQPAIARQLYFCTLSYKILCFLCCICPVYKNGLLLGNQK